MSAGGTPYLEVGARGSPAIVPDNLAAFGISWDDPQPLAFLNGCHTTSVTQKDVMEFVTSFVVEARAAGVIGTEITVLEKLARGFAEDCLRRFIAGERIGTAVRAARLALLKNGNPLGLACTPFVLPALRLVARA